jgi:hypothetical protein
MKIEALTEHYQTRRKTELNRVQVEPEKIRAAAAWLRQPQDTHCLLRRSSYERVLYRNRQPQSRSACHFSH